MMDFHTHILPGIDDGSSSIEESVKMIKMLKEQGVNEILLTPHFYAYLSSVESFNEERASLMNELSEAIKKEGIDVTLYLGCEVLYFDEIWRVEDIRSLCINGTDYILVEMPFDSWSNSIVENVTNILSRGCVPVLAHFERYLRYSGNLKKIRSMVEAGVFLQMNCSYVNGFFTRRKAISMIKSGAVIALGTDCHNTDMRSPDYEEAIAVLRKKLSKTQFLKFVTKQKELLKNADKIKFGNSGLQGNI